MINKFQIIINKKMIIVLIKEKVLFLVVNNLSQGLVEGDDERKSSKVPSESKIGFQSVFRREVKQKCKSA